MPAPYPFGPILAADPSNTENVAKGGTVLIYAPGDTSKTPLALTDLSFGMAVPNPLPINSNGFGPAFLADLDQVAWEGGGFAGTFESYGAMRDDAKAAAADAELSRIAAEDAASSAVAPTDEVVNAVLTNTESLGSQAVAETISTAIEPLALKPDNGGKPVGKGELVSYAKDFGLVGDGSDEFAKLKTFLETGGVLQFEKGKTYSYTASAVINTPANTIVIGYGAKLYELAATDAYRIVFNSNTIIDSLDISFAGGASGRGVLLQGDNISIGSFKAVSRDHNNGYGNYRRRPISIGAEGGTNSNISIDRLYVENWEYGPAVFNTVGCRLGSVRQVAVKQGLLIRDSTNVTVHSGYHKTISPLVKGNPGENAILIEATTADNSVTDITVSNFKSYASGEHGFRLGGQYQMRNITFDNCFSAAAGMGIGSGVEPDNHGGCGFKVLGPTSIMDSNARHTNIRFLNCTVESLNPANAAKAKDNFAGFNICKAKNVTITNPIVRAAPTSGYADGTYSAWNGIEIVGSENVTISNPTISSCANAGISFYNLTATGSTNWGDGNTYVTVDGGSIRGCVNSSIEFINTTETMRDVEIHGTTIEGGNYGIYATTVANGLLNRCTATINAKSNLIANTINLSNMTVEIMGDEIGSNAVRNGSVIVNYSTGQRKFRANSSWIIASLSDTTAKRPSGAAVGQPYFDTTLGRPVWLKSGTTWVDATGATV